MQSCENISEELKKILFGLFLSACQSNPLKWKLLSLFDFSKRYIHYVFLPFLTLFSLWTSYHFMQWPAGSVFTKKCTFGVMESIKHEINQCRIIHTLLPAHPGTQIKFHTELTEQLTCSTDNRHKGVDSKR